MEEPEDKREEKKGKLMEKECREGTDEEKRRERRKGR